MYNLFGIFFTKGCNNFLLTSSENGNNIRILQGEDYHPRRPWTTQVISRAARTVPRGPLLSPLQMPIRSHKPESNHQPITPHLNYYVRSPSFKTVWHWKTRSLPVVLRTKHDKARLCSVPTVEPVASPMFYFPLMESRSFDLRCYYYKIVHIKTS